MSSFAYDTAENAKKAKMNFKRLLPQAKEEAKKDAANIKTGSAIGEQILPWMTIDNVLGVHIYENEYGGWVTDIQLKEVPSGMSCVFGTPVAQPMETEEEAEKAGVYLLTTILSNDSSPESRQIPEVIKFIYHDVVISLGQDLISKFKDSEVGQHFSGKQEYVMDKFRELDEKHGVEMSADQMDKLPKEEVQEIYVTVLMALLAGIPKWPQSEPVPPKSKLH